MELRRVTPFLIPDALIGYGLNGYTHGVVMDLIRRANAGGSPVLSLDVPSGLDASTGLAQGACIRATKTMTLALPKHGLRASNYVGELRLADIGIGSAIHQRLGLHIPDLFAGTPWIRLKAGPGESPILPGTPMH